MGLSSFIFLWWAPKDIMCNVNNAQWPFKVSSGSSKVVDFGTDRKRLCGFLLVLNSNLGRILHSFGDTAAYRSKKCKIARSNPLQSQKSPSLEVTPCEFFDESYLARSLHHGSIGSWRNNDASSLRFDTIPAVTDGQPDGHVAVANTRSTHSVPRVKTKVWDLSKTCLRPKACSSHLRS